MVLIQVSEQIMTHRKSILITDGNVRKRILIGYVGMWAVGGVSRDRNVASR